MAKFYGIGTGPGDPKLLTVGAVEVLGKLDILYAPQSKKGGDSLALSIVKEYLKDDLEIKERHFPMVKDVDIKSKAWDEISSEIVKDVEKGNEVGFITLGDPMIYSTYIYLFERLRGKIETVTIPGISSFSNIASKENYPLVVDDEELIIVPCNMDMSDVKEAIKNYSSVVLMKVYKNFGEIYEFLEEQKLLKNALMVVNSSHEDEIVYRDLGEVNRSEKLSYFSTIIINKNFNTVD